MLKNQDMKQMPVKPIDWNGTFFPARTLELCFRLYITLLEKVTRFTGFAGGKVIKAIHLTFRLQSSSLFADSTWPF